MCESTLCASLSDRYHFGRVVQGGVSELLSDHVAKKLMYIEAVVDIDRGHWEVGRERKGRAYLTAEGQKKEVSGGGGGRDEGVREEEESRDSLEVSGEAGMSE